MNIPLRTAVPTPLRQQVVDILRNAITECLFEPGGRLTERELCASLGVSRSTIREGLRQLEAEGLVRMTPNKGPMVAILGEAEAREVYAIRATLEGMASALSAERANAAAIQELERHLDEMREATAKDDFLGLQKPKTQFYEVLFECAGNEQLSIMLKQLRARVTLMRGLDAERQRRMAESVRGASEILAAIKRRDIAAAREAGESHIQRAASLTLEAAEIVSKAARAGS